MVTPTRFRVESVIHRQKRLAADETKTMLSPDFITVPLTRGTICIETAKEKELAKDSIASGQLSVLAIIHCIFIGIFKGLPGW